MDVELDDTQKEVLREWRASASYWEKHAGTIRMMFSPVTDALIESAGIKQGDAVLDVACGAGEPSLTIAEVVGPTGLITATDVVPEMVAAAQSQAERRQLKNISFKQASADSLPFKDESFDAVVSRLGVMFFPDPVAALREMLRVTKSGGSITLVVWDKSEVNPFYYLIANVTSRYFEAAPADPNAPGAFRFAEAGSASRILEEAGAADVRERVLKFRMAAPISPDQFWEMRSQVSGTLREKLATLSKDEQSRIAEEVKQSVVQFFPNNQMSFPAQMIIVTGRKR